jgi:hypothetical protein
VGAISGLGVSVVVATGVVVRKGVSVGSCVTVNVGIAVSGIVERISGEFVAAGAKFPGFA